MEVPLDGWGEGPQDSEPSCSPELGAAGKSGREGAALTSHR